MTPYQKIAKKSLAIRKLIRPQPGNVKTHVSIISLTTEKFIALRRREAPTPMIALVFVCVVETGMPKIDERSRQREAARSALNP